MQTGGWDRSFRGGAAALPDHDSIRSLRRDGSVRAPLASRTLDGQKPVDAHRAASASVSTSSDGTQRTAGVAASPTHSRFPRRLTATHRPSFVINGVLAQMIRSRAPAPSGGPPEGLLSSFGCFQVALQAFRSYTGNSEKTHSPSPYNAAMVASIFGNCLARRTGPRPHVYGHLTNSWCAQSLLCCRAVLFACSALISARFEISYLSLTLSPLTSMTSK